MWKIINKYLGWRNWAVLYYNSIFENFYVFFYIALRHFDTSNAYIGDILYFLLFSLFSTTYGYLINDYSDRDLDRLHGKPNTFAGDSSLKAILIIVLFFVLSIAAAAPFWLQKYFAVLWLSWLLITTFYSLPPLRLKERGKGGLILVIIAQRLIPVLLIFAAFQFYHLFEIIIISLYILFRGASSDINHQLEDYENDEKTGTKTAAVNIGKSRMEKLFRFVLLAERVLLFVFTLLVAWYLNDITLWNIPVFVIPSIVFIFLYILALLNGKKSMGGIPDINPYHARKNIYQLIHLVLPNIFLPLFFLAVLIPMNLCYLFFIAVFIVIYRIYDIQVIKNSFIGRLFFREE